jgi:ribosome-associated translation inhibitor RaiA
MQLDLRTKALDLTTELQEYVAKRLRFALDRHTEHVRRIEVSLEDVNGPRGGVDKACRIHVLSSAGTLHVRELQADIRTAVDVGADRIGKLIAHRLARSLRRSRPRRTVATLAPDFIPLPA